MPGIGIGTGIGIGKVPPLPPEVKFDLLENGLDFVTVLTPQIAGHNLKNKLGLIKFGNNDNRKTKIYT